MSLQTPIIHCRELEKTHREMFSQTIMSLQTHIIHWRELEKAYRGMFSRTNYMEEDSTKNHLTSAKTLQKIIWV